MSWTPSNPPIFVEICPRWSAPHIAPLPLTNKPYRPRLRFESCLTYGALQVLFTYLLTYLAEI